MSKNDIPNGSTSSNLLSEILLNDKDPSFPYGQHFVHRPKKKKHTHALCKTNTF